MKLEKSIIELHSMFMNMSMLVDQQVSFFYHTITIFDCIHCFPLYSNQGELVDQIEYNVNNALDYIQTGNVTMKKALIYQNRARRVGFCIL